MDREYLFIISSILKNIYPLTQSLEDNFELMMSEHCEGRRAL